ncbi:hypothetical protein BDA96_03G188100 [Sorghum bicolor]|uniref:Uncharacterized protein n=1 Tax=Sorghum bicolor TaxID=4558 RepID=A0A921UMP9_SORBI|nr:hypothetical protein BDA96_03G188100 [Sorghum bicolor]
MKSARFRWVNLARTCTLSIDLANHICYFYFGYHNSVSDMFHSSSHI